MIKEEFVTFETAKLLKELGFPQDDAYKAYDHEGWLFAHADECDGDYYVAPTQPQAMRWLRDRERIIVSPDYRWDGAWGCVLKSQRFNIYKCYPKDYDEYLPAYEAAAEIGIQEACKYLIEKGGEK